MLSCSLSFGFATLSGSGFAALAESGHGAAASVAALQGTTASVVSFGSIIKSSFTICSVTRYTGGIKWRILNGGGQNWLHGHGGEKAGVAYYRGWKTSRMAGSVSPNTDWVVMCGTNAGSQLKLVNGVDVGTASGGLGGVSLWINGGNYMPGAGSDFAIAELITWPRGLTSDEVYCASDYLISLVLAPTAR